jgi:MtN3 and saliva related transmembrane protein
MRYYMNIVTFIGLTAAVCTTIAYLPQVIRSWKTKKTDDLSLPMYSVLTAGIFFWLVYGYFLNDAPLMLANGVTFIFAAIILFLKIKHG